MPSIAELAALFAGIALILGVTATLIRKQSLAVTELTLAALGLVLVAGPTFLASIKFGKDGFEVVSRLAVNTQETIEQLSKKVDLISARLDAFVPSELKPSSATPNAKPATGKDWLDTLKNQPAEKTQDFCQRFPALCIRKTDGFLLNDQKVIDFGNDFKALNETSGKIQVLMQESNDLKSAIEKKKLGAEKLG